MPAGLLHAFMKDGRVFAKSGEFVLRNVGRESVLVPIRNRVGDLDSVFTLTPVAARIWELIDGRTAVDAIAARVCDEYDVTEDVAMRDLVELLEGLEAAQLVRQG
ncbi:MAG TPA: PqqD family protein [Thermoanaerobaculia bacterium]|nr:PqqD family protein [Thermoanaerobaculia bacterium]